MCQSPRRFRIRVGMHDQHALQCENESQVKHEVRRILGNKLPNPGQPRWPEQVRRVPQLTPHVPRVVIDLRRQNRYEHDRRFERNVPEQFDDLTERRSRVFQIRRGRRDQQQVCWLWRGRPRNRNAGRGGCNSAGRRFRPVGVGAADVATINPDGRTRCSHSELPNDTRP